MPGLFWPDDEWTAPTLRDSMGRQVAAVTAGNHFDSADADEQLRGELEFAFSLGQPLVVTTTHMDGVRAYPYPILEKRLEDGFHWQRRELSTIGPWSSLVGTRLVSVGALIKPDIGYGFEAGVTGLLFTFSSGGRVGYENWDDDRGPRASFDPSGGVWSDGQVIEWMRCTDSGRPAA